jgi:hypothetical protein
LLNELLNGNSDSLQTIELNTIVAVLISAKTPQIAINNNNNNINLEMKSTIEEKNSNLLQKLYKFV